MSLVLHMIKNKRDLKDYICSDNHWLLGESTKDNLISDFAKYPHRSIKKLLKYLRKQEYYINTSRGGRLSWLKSIYYERKKNKIGNSLGIEIPPNCFGKGLNVYHIGSIIINPNVRAGEGCSLHGANCIGNNGLTEDAPRLGDRVDVGYGAVIIGDIEIADDVKIGANAVVNKSVLEPGCTVAGVPARIVKRNA